jgi:hypothetical protein
MNPAGFDGGATDRQSPTRIFGPPVKGCDSLLREPHSRCVPKMTNSGNLKSISSRMALLAEAGRGLRRECGDNQTIGTPA